MSAAVLTVTEMIIVKVVANDYSYEGTLAGIVIKRNGAIRYVVEDNNGRLFIHDAEQIGKSDGWMP